MEEGVYFFAKNPAPVEIISDINRDLIKFYKTIQKVNSLDEIIKYGWIPDRQRFKELAKCIKENICELNDPLFKAYAFLYLNRFSYGSNVGGALSYAPGREKDCVGSRAELCRISNVYRHFDELKDRLKHAKILRADFRDVLKKYDHRLMFTYLDPPYYTEEKAVQYQKVKYGTEIIKPEEVYDAVKNLRGKFLLSYNDSPRIRALFKRYIIQPIKLRWPLSMQKGGSFIFGDELLIRNYGMRIKGGD